MTSTTNSSQHCWFKFSNFFFICFFYFIFTFINLQNKISLIKILALKLSKIYSMNIRCLNFFRFLLHIVWDKRQDKTFFMLTRRVERRRRLGTLTFKLLFFWGTWANHKHLRRFFSICRLCVMIVTVLNQTFA